MNLKRIWAYMLLFAILDGLITRFGLASGAIELNPLVNVDNILAHQIIEIQVITILIVLNAILVFHSDTVKYGVRLFRTVSVANKWIMRLLLVVIIWNSLNIALDLIV